MRKQRLIACGAVLLGTIVVGGAQADPAGAPSGHGKPESAGLPGKADGKGKDHDKRDRDKGGKGERDKNDDKSPPGRAFGRGALHDLFQELKEGKLKKGDVKERLAKLRANLSERKVQHQAELKQRWGATLALPAVRQELEHHARRMARLHRVLLLAETEVTKDKDKLADRIRGLIDKEQERHERAMERFKTMPTTPAASAGPSAVPAAPAPAASAKAGDK